MKDLFKLGNLDEWSIHIDIKDDNPVYRHNRMNYESIESVYLYKGNRIYFNETEISIYAENHEDRFFYIEKIKDNLFIITHTYYA